MTSLSILENHPSTPLTWGSTDSSSPDAAYGPTRTIPVTRACEPRCGIDFDCRRDTLFRWHAIGITIAFVPLLIRGHQGKVMSWVQTALYFVLFFLFLCWVYTELCFSRLERYMYACDGEFLGINMASDVTHLSRGMSCVGMRTWIARFEAIHNSQTL